MPIDEDTWKRDPEGYITRAEAEAMIGNAITVAHSVNRHLLMALMCGFKDIDSAAIAKFLNGAARSVTNAAERDMLIDLAKGASLWSGAHATVVIVENAPPADGAN